MKVLPIKKRVRIFGRRHIMLDLPFQRQILKGEMYEGNNIH